MALLPICFWIHYVQQLFSACSWGMQERTWHKERCEADTWQWVTVWMASSLPSGKPPPSQPAQLWEAVFCPENHVCVLSLWHKSLVAVPVSGREEQANANMYILSHAHTHTQNVFFQLLKYYFLWYHHMKITVIDLLHTGRKCTLQFCKGY